MKKHILLGTISAMLLVSGFASAQTADIASLQKIIDDLRAQIAALTQSQQQSAAQIATLQSQLKLSRNLHQGESGDDVKLLQQTLATDPSLFPGAPTGFFGNLTREAVKKLQERLGLEQTGEIGPQTRGQLNQLFGDVSSSTMGLPIGLLRGGFAPIHFDIQTVGNIVAEGQASLFPVDGSSTRVVVHFASRDDLSASGTPATYATHIHQGACASTSPITIPLTDIANNKSETTIQKTIAQLVGMYPLSIMVHKAGVVVGCGDLPIPRPIYKKMDMNGDGKIDDTDMMELQQVEQEYHQSDLLHAEQDRLHNQKQAEQDRQHNNQQDRIDLQKKFMDLEEHLWNGAQGIIPEMMPQQRKQGDGQHGGDGQNREGQ